MDLAELTTWTRDGTVDLVAVDRFIRGEPVALTDAEREVVIHALAEAGHGPSTIAARVGLSHDSCRRHLTRTTPTDRQGNPIHTLTERRTP